MELDGILNVQKGRIQSLEKEIERLQSVIQDQIQRANVFEYELEYVRGSVVELEKTVEARE